MRIGVMGDCGIVTNARGSARKPIRVLSLAALLVVAPTLLCAVDSPLWGNLVPGPYFVGYRVVDELDLSRPGEGSGNARAIRLHLWYPAQSSAGPFLRLGDYVDVDAFRAHAIELGGSKEGLDAGLPRILQMQTNAVLNAHASDGKFPVVLVPAFLAPSTISILSEYLASHGYVVASVPMMGSLDKDPEISPVGLESQVLDLMFALRIVRSLSQSDGGKIAVMGTGFNASPCMALAMRNPLVGAVISLDGGILSELEALMLQRLVYYDPRRVRVPVLAIYGPHPNINPVFLDPYRYSERTIALFPAMSEYYFLNFGMLEALLPGIIGKPPGDTRAGYTESARLVLAFLEARFRGRPFSVKGTTCELSTKPALEPPPTLSQLKAAFSKSNGELLIDAYNRLKTSDPQPFSQDDLASLNSWLAWNRDPDFKLRRIVGQIRAQSYPQSSRAHFSLAQAYQRTGEMEQARIHYQQALDLLDKDPDVSLGPVARKRIRDAANDAVRQDSDP